LGEYVKLRAANLRPVVTGQFHIGMTPVEHPAGVEDSDVICGAGRKQGPRCKVTKGMPWSGD
jgi:hypothetical protein